MRTIGKVYNLNNVAGLASQHKAHSSGVIVRVFQTQQAGITGTAPWTVECVHGNRATATKYPDALKLQSEPETFCPECKRLAEQVQQIKAIKNDPNRPRSPRGRKPKIIAQLAAASAEALSTVVEQQSAQTETMGLIEKDGSVTIRANEEDVKDALNALHNFVTSNMLPLQGG